jgi:hypothetical protein
MPYITIWLSQRATHLALALRFRGCWIARVAALYPSCSLPGVDFQKKGRMGISGHWALEVVHQLVPGCQPSCPWALTGDGWTPARIGDKCI